MTIARVKLTQAITKTAPPFVAGPYQELHQLCQVSTLSTHPDNSMV
jgi:hypothetical protein